MNKEKTFCYPINFSMEGTGLMTARSTHDRSLVQSRVGNAAILLAPRGISNHQMDPLHKFQLDSPASKHHAKRVSKDQN